MQLTSRKNSVITFSTESIFGKLDPQPEIQIRPLGRREKITLIEECTNIKMVPHPEKPGQHLQAEVFDKFRFAQETIYRCVVGLKHFERSDGTPLQPVPEDIDFLLEAFDEGTNKFELWLQDCIKSAHDHIEQTEEDARKNFSNGRGPIASPKAKP